MSDIEKVRRELRRRSLDQIKVFNPLDIPFQTVWEGFTYVAQPKQETVFLRYIAEKWMKEFIDYMINNEEREAVIKENEKRRKKGWEPMDAQEHDKFVLTNKLVTNDPDKRLGYMRIIYRGVTQEHGLDMPQPEPVKRDIRPQDEKILEMLDKEMGVRNELPDDDFEDLEEDKDRLLEEISE